MKDLYFPNYTGSGLVNLMSTISESFGKKSEYKPLTLLKNKNLKKSKNIVLLVIDGLGYNYLCSKKDSALYRHLKGKMTSVFVPTTSCAITTFLTGVAPNKHAYTGWFVNLKEYGVVSAILPFSARVGGPPLSAYGCKISSVLLEKSFISKLSVKSYSVVDKGISKSPFNSHLGHGSKLIEFSSLSGMFKGINKAIRSNTRRKYIYSYWPKFDSFNHQLGVGHNIPDLHFKEIDKKFASFIKSIKGTNTTVIITADHGFINADLKDIIWLKDHPKLKDCLSLPLCGEGRTAYCYVHVDKAKEFEKYVTTKLSKYCYLMKSSDILKRKLLGPGKDSPVLHHRIGDYALLMKKNYVFKDKFDNSTRPPHIGHHGGLSEDEMMVPLIVVDC